MAWTKNYPLTTMKLSTALVDCGFLFVLTEWLPRAIKTKLTATQIKYDSKGTMRISAKDVLRANLNAVILCCGMLASLVVLPMLFEMCHHAYDVWHQTPEHTHGLLGTITNAATMSLYTILLLYYMLAIAAAAPFFKAERVVELYNRVNNREMETPFEPARATFYENGELMMQYGVWSADTNEWVVIPLTKEQSATAKTFQVAVGTECHQEGDRNVVTSLGADAIYQPKKTARQNRSASLVQRALRYIRKQMRVLPKNTRANHILVLAHLDTFIERELNDDLREKDWWELRKAVSVLAFIPTDQDRLVTKMLRNPDVRGLMATYRLADDE